MALDNTTSVPGIIHIAMWVLRWCEAVISPHTSMTQDGLLAQDPMQGSERKLKSHEDALQKAASETIRLYLLGELTFEDRSKENSRGDLSDVAKVLSGIGMVPPPRVPPGGEENGTPAPIG